VQKKTEIKKSAQNQNDEERTEGINKKKKEDLENVYGNAKRTGFPTCCPATVRYCPKSMFITDKT
jgi:hypothetical protein